MAELNDRDLTEMSKEEFQELLEDFRLRQVELIEDKYEETDTSDDRLATTEAVPRKVYGTHVLESSNST